ncbi:MFS transporter [Saccharopolyspora spinosa]|uniref:MFS family arabinose efflux permease n=1 Tax=Saccharopolyspora spinosa TaxID=60894 RepID=A0A2N3XYQ5_SACSN|nr:MFS transporter [Saccharopolyspora spinosa]PKW15804.1 putative MFS family arabinose efflux permease [Saccharopolyspora spinosa]
MSSATPVPAVASRRSRLVIGVLASCGIAVSLMQTLVVPLLPEFPRLLDTSTSNAGWLVTAPLVAGAVCAPVLGRLGDMYGKRWMLLISLATMAVGSAIGAVSDDFAAVLVGRVLQGAAVGVVPLGISIMRDELPEDRVGSGVALMSATLGIGGAVGLPVTGVVAENLNWHWLFVGAAVFAIVEIVLILRVVPESPLRAGGRFDFIGAVGLSAALTCLLLAISKGNEWGWTSGVILGLLVAATALFLVWGFYELRVSAPLVDLRVSARPAVLLTNIASVLVGIAMFAGFLVGSQIMQAPEDTGYGFGMSLVVTGLVLLPIGAAMGVFSPVSARISRRRGPRTTLILGGTVLMLGNLAGSFLHSPLPLVVFNLTVGAIGGALSYGALPTLIMQAVPQTETAAANSLNSLARSIGTSTCSAIVVALTTGSVVQIAGVNYPSVFAYSWVFLVAGAAALLAALIAAATPRTRRYSPVTAKVATTLGTSR